MSDLVGNPEDRFSQNEALLMSVSVMFTPYVRADQKKKYGAYLMIFDDN